MKCYFRSADILITFVAWICKCYLRVTLKWPVGTLALVGSVKCCSRSNNMNQESLKQTIKKSMNNCSWQTIF